MIDNFGITNDASNPTDCLNVVQLGTPFILKPNYSYRIKIAHIFEEFIGESILNQTDPFNKQAVGLWQFEDTYHDVDNNWNSTPNGTVSIISGGKFGKAVDLVGNSGNYVHLGDFPPTPAKELTISMWINQQSVHNDWSPVFFCSARNADGSTIGSRTPAVWLRPNAQNLHIRNDGVSTNNLGIDATSFSLTLGVWEHVVVVVTLREMKVYFNGELKDTYVPSEDFYFAPTLNYSYLGNPSSSHPLVIYIDQYRYFNRALTDYEIQSLYLEKYASPFLGG